MQEIDKLLENMKVTRIDHLSIVAAFCRRIGLIETVNRVVPTEMDVDVGTIVQAMVLDTLSGRSPLYRLADFFKHLLFITLFYKIPAILGLIIPPVVFRKR